MYAMIGEDFHCLLQQASMVDNLRGQLEQHQDEALKLADASAATIVGLERRLTMMATMTERALVLQSTEREELHQATSQCRSLATKSQLDDWRLEQLRQKEASLQSRSP